MPQWSRVFSGDSFVKREYVDVMSNISRYILNVVMYIVFVSALELLKNAIAKAGYTDKIVIGMDVAASEFYKGGKYDLDFKSPDDPSRYISPDKLADLYRSFVKDYPGGFLTHTLFLIAVKLLLLTNPKKCKVSKILWRSI